MSGVTFNQLHSFYTGLPRKEMSLGQINQQIIEYLNKNVHAHENAQPTAFTEKYINKISENLQKGATTASAFALIVAIDLWKASWLTKMKKPSFEHKSETPSKSFAAELHKNSNGSPKASFQGQFPLEGVFSTSSAKKSKEAKTENFSDQAVNQSDHTFTKQWVIDLISQKPNLFFEKINNKNLEDILAGWKGKDGENVFHLACAHSRPEILRYLSGIGVDLSALDHSGKNGMHYAVIHHNNEAIDYLFAQGQGYQLHIADSKGYTPMHSAILDKATNTFIRLFLGSLQNFQSQSLPTNDNELHIAAFSGLTSVFSLGLLVSSYKYGLSQTNRDRRTPLQMAAEHGHLGIVRLICMLGKVTKREREDAVILAYKASQRKIFEFLTTQSVAHAPTYEDLKENPKRMQKLINKGLDINGLQDGKSMLHRAIEDNSLELVKQMIEKGGALLTIKAESSHFVAGSEPGLPPFYFAAALGRKEIVQYLNETFYSRNEAMKSLCGFHANPIEFAAQFGHGAAIRSVLLNRGWLA